MAERLVHGFSNLIATIQDRRQLTSTNNNILVPFYTVIVSGGQRVYESYAVMPSKPISLIALFYWFVMNVMNVMNVICYNIVNNY